MANRDWRPFVYGGLASCIAEFGMFLLLSIKQLIKDSFLQVHFL